MSSLLQQLNNESILLMYVAGELPPEDRADLEKMLASDARLREQLGALQSAYDGARDAIVSADRSERLVLPAATAARRVGVAVRAWHARRLAMPLADEARRGLRFPWWCYPLASAAGLVVIAISWWSMGDHGPVFMPAGPGISMTTGLNEEIGLPSSTPTDTVATSETPFDVTFPVLHDARDQALDDVEDQLIALSQPADDGVNIMQLIGETNER